MMSDNRPLKNRPPSNEDALKLRQMTGEGLMDCKKALHKAQGDMALAEAYLLSPGFFGPRLVYPDRSKHNSFKRV
jgi:hypothetical protein